MAEDNRTKTESDEMLDLAGLFSEAVRTVVRDAIAEMNIEQCCYAVAVEQTEGEDDRWSVRKVDGGVIIDDLMNCTGRTLAPGATVVVSYIGNNLSGGYISRALKVPKTEEDKP